MRTYDASDEHDKSEAAKLGAEPWMLSLLALNPEYVHWGPHEDYMWTKGEGWNSPQIIESWKSFDWALDDLNECVNFYFQIRRDSRDCGCHEGYNEETGKIAKAFYNLDGDRSKAWHDKITQDECDALVASSRLWDLTRKFVDGKWTNIEPAPVVTAEQVNERERVGHVHDAINRHVLVEARAKRLGVYGTCPRCDGTASVYTELTAHASLVLWILHPRKGCSRGVEIKHIDRDDLPAIRLWLQSAAARNAQRFGQAVARLPRVAP